MQFKHAPAAVSAAFDDPNLVSAAGVVPMLRLARSAGLDELAQSRLSVPTDKGSNAGAKVMAPVAPSRAGLRSRSNDLVVRYTKLVPRRDDIHKLRPHLDWVPIGENAEYLRLPPDSGH